ncbi:MAG: general secretion pathway protein GspK [Gammaproteobacteria bacterium]|nr:general secretion pathway protein GspK [Gammaproteobacteria bacterium]
MKRKSQQGIALIVVLWFIVLLSILALGFSRSVRTEIRIIHNLVEDARARHLAEAAVQKGVFELLHPDNEDLELLLYGAENSFDFDGQQLSYAIQNEQGKVDINNATDEVLVNLLTVLGVDSTAAAEITDAIGDWRDENDLRRLNGAELDDYEAAGLETVPTNAPFINIAELQQVMGIDGDLYRKMEAHVTVHAFSEGINPLFAGREVLQSLPGVSESEVDEIVASRDRFSEGEAIEPFPLLTGVESTLSTEVGPLFSVKGKAILSSKAVSVRNLTIWVTDSNLDSPYHVMDSRSGEIPAAKAEEE